MVDAQFLGGTAGWGRIGVTKMIWKKTYFCYYLLKTVLKNLIFFIFCRLFEHFLEAKYHWKLFRHDNLNFKNENQFSVCNLLQVIIMHVYILKPLILFTGLFQTKLPYLRMADLWFLDPPLLNQFSNCFIVHNYL